MFNGSPRPKIHDLKWDESDSMLHYLKGDATDPVGKGPKILTHCCNDIGLFGAGFALAIAKKWPQVKDLYLAWYRSDPTLLSNDPSSGTEITGRMKLGESQIIRVREDLWVVNIIGQHGVAGSSGRPPIRYDALKKGLGAVCRWAGIYETSVHMPRIGAGLAGGSWPSIEAFIKSELSNRGVEVTVYSL